MDESNIAAIERLISKIEVTPKLTKREIEKLANRDIVQVFEKLKSGEEIVLNAPPQPESYLFAEGGGGVKSVDNDITALIDIVQSGIDGYSKTGMYPAPHYAWRIAILLRKDKRPDLEARFLKAYSAKFSDGLGRRYQDLAKRVEKAEILARKLDV